MAYVDMTGVFIYKGLLTAAQMQQMAANDAYLLSQLITHGSQVFTSSGTFNVPTGITTAYVTAVGGGGGKGLSGGSVPGYGGGGATSIKAPIAVTAGAAITVTLGAAGTDGGVGANGGAGGNTTFGALLTVNGGAGGTSAPAGGAGGSAPSGGVAGSNGTLINGGLSLYSVDHASGFGCGTSTAGVATAGFCIVEW